MAGTPLTLTAFADDRRYFSGGNGSEATQPISAARFSLAAPSWVTGTVTLPLTAADGSFNSTAESVSLVIDTTDWPAGRHLLFVESQDSDGNWGVPSALFVQSFSAGTTWHYLPFLHY